MNRTIRLALLGIVGLSVATGCASNGADERDFDEPSSEDDELRAQKATITFESNGDVTKTGRLVSGGKVEVRYRQDRVRAKCRATESDGRATWSIKGYAHGTTLSASTEAGDNEVFETARVSADGQSRIMTTKILYLAHSGYLSLYFENVDKAGCSSIDAGSAQPHLFSVEPRGNPPAAELVFRQDGNIEMPAPLVAGESVRVRYASSRNLECQDRYGTWEIDAHARFNGKPSTIIDTDRVDAPGRNPIDETIELDEAGTLSMWFHTRNGAGCSSYDSRGGKNYDFEVARRR